MHMQHVHLGVIFRDMLLIKSKFKIFAILYLKRDKAGNTRLDRSSILNHPTGNRKSQYLETSDSQSISGAPTTGTGNRYPKYIIINHIHTNNQTLRTYDGLSIDPLRSMIDLKCLPIGRPLHHVISDRRIVDFRNTID